MGLKISKIKAKAAEPTVTTPEGTRLRKPRKVKTELPGELWSISCYFNPMRYRSRLRNFLLFYDRLSSQCPNVLITELAATEADLMLHRYLRPTSLLQLTTGNEETLWQKEALLNLTIDTLPDTCDKVCWLDCDVLIDNDKWVKTTSKALTDFVVVQPFDTSIRLNNDVLKIPLDASSYRPLKGFAKEYLDEYRGEPSEFGHPGYACAFRRFPLMRGGGLFDTCIIGGGDRYIARAIMDIDLERNYSEKHTEQYEQWKTVFQQHMQHSFTHLVNTTVYHLYHGKQSDRQYHKRLEKFDELRYDPSADLVKQDNGLYKLSAKGQIFKTWLKDFFIRRQEDG